ncbi:MAG: hypothetical protein A2413_08500, partial [Treponema sp. RIFOXYC1_FULL_61_9]
KAAVRNAFAGKNGTIQVSVRPKPGETGETGEPEGQSSEKTAPEKIGTHFMVKDGKLSCFTRLAGSPDIELEFPSLKAFNGFFAGKSMKLPRIRGALKAPGLLVATFTGLLAMSAALGAKEAPKTAEERALLVKLFFYLLSSGISRLNKTGHPAVSKWASVSPDRVYAFSVDGRPDLGAYIRVKAGNTRAARGVYERSKPFFTMSFDSVDSALGILLEKDDMIEATVSRRISMLGAPEYGAMLGEYMKLVGAYAK